MITKSNKIKVWAISLLDLALCLAVGIFFEVEFTALEILSTLPILAFAYLVTAMNKKWAVWLWIASFVFPRVLNFSQIASGGMGILSIVFGVAFLAVIIRCFLQWTANIWRNTDRKIPKKLLNLWIYSEELLVIATTSAILTLFMHKEHSHIVTILSILGLGALYRKVKQYFSMALNGPNHSTGDIMAESIGEKRS